MTQLLPILFVRNMNPLPFGASRLSRCRADGVGTLLNQQRFIAGYEVAGSQGAAQVLLKLRGLQLHQLATL